VLTSLDQNLYLWDFENLCSQETEAESIFPSWASMKFPSPLISLSMEPNFGQGIAGTHCSGILYFNFEKQYRTVLVGTPKFEEEEDPNIPSL